MSQDQWFFTSNGQQAGPVTWADLAGRAAAGSLTPGDYVWREGMPNWVPASTIPNLFGLGPVAPVVPAAPGGWPMGMPVTGFSAYAGFWKRVAAAIIDILLLWAASIPCTVGSALLGMTGRASGHVHDQNPLGCCFLIVVSWLYSALMEASDRQATLGKMALGIIVTDEFGNRLSFGRATGRHFAQYISIITLMIGFIITAFTEKKQALHDMIAGTLVVNRTV